MQLDKTLRPSLYNFYHNRAATANLSQARSYIIPKNLLTGCFLKEGIETQNLGKDQTLPALPAVGALITMTYSWRILTMIGIKIGFVLYSILQ